MKQLNPLTGLRGIAAYSVLVAHSISNAFVYNGINLFQPFASRLVFFGISLFFVLSGFLITYLLQVKDKHNGNIMICRDGSLRHIDYGFFISNSPGKGMEM